MTSIRLFGASAVLLATLAQDPSVSSLDQARELYNRQQWDAAIEAAALARQTLPERADEAAVVLARAHLERYRVVNEPSDLDAARAVFKEVNPDALGPAERVEFLVGLGVSLYLDDRGGFEERYSAAAELFETALRHADATTGIDRRERILEWWCGSLDRQTQYVPEVRRPLIYARLLERVETELAHDDLSTVALYWQVAALRGVGQLERAWGAAIATWMRSRYLGAPGVRLRADLDQLVVEVILPERARALTPDADPRPTLDGLLSRWAEFKARWDAPAPVRP